MSDNALLELLTGPLAASKLECEDCGHVETAWSSAFVKPEVKFPCFKCGSRNTQRYCIND